MDFLPPLLPLSAPCITVLVRYNKNKKNSKIKNEQTLVVIDFFILLKISTITSVIAHYNRNGVFGGKNSFAGIKSSNNGRSQPNFAGEKTLTPKSFVKMYN